ncbi:MAG: hypothetical protein AB8F95_09550 [Bacteroidia bacterium]
MSKVILIAISLLAISCTSNNNYFEGGRSFHIGESDSGNQTTTPEIDSFRLDSPKDSTSKIGPKIIIRYE